MNIYVLFNKHNFFVNRLNHSCFKNRKHVPEKIKVAINWTREKARKTLFEHLEALFKKVSKVILKKGIEAKRRLLFLRCFLN
jgi:hypothetical protein